MARLRPFRGLRYTPAAGELSSLLAPPSSFLTPAEREGYVARNAYNAVHLAQPEGHGDDRSKFIRYARAAARLAEWRRGEILGVEPRPAFYRVVQRFGPTSVARTALLAVVLPDEHVRAVEEESSRLHEERLRLLEATRAVFEPSVGFYDDPSRAAARTVHGATASNEVAVAFSGISLTVETVDDPDQTAILVEAFREVTVSLADNVEGYLAAGEFAPHSGGLVALVSLNEPSLARLAVHRVIRRMPGGLEAMISRLGEIFDVEEHHNRNLIHYIDRTSDEGRSAFGLATEGGRGFLLRPRHSFEGAPSVWLRDRVLVPIFKLGESDPTLLFTDPVQAVRVADEGAAAALILPRPGRDEVQSAARTGVALPAGSVRTYPAVPTGLVFRAMGDDV